MFSTSDERAKVGKKQFDIASNSLVKWKYHGSNISYIKVCGPDVVTLLNWTPRLEWYKHGKVYR